MVPEILDVVPSGEHRVVFLALLEILRHILCFFIIGAGYGFVFLQSVQRQCLNVVFLHHLAQLAGVARSIAYYKGFVFHAIVQSCENRIKLRRFVRIVPASQPFPHQQPCSEDCQDKYGSLLHGQLGFSIHINLFISL